MAEPLSISQIDRLGDRLRKSAATSEEDLELLEEVRAKHRAPMTAAQESLTFLDFPSTSRLKTTATIIDKLRREKTRLSKMQDIAGVRFVRDMTLDEQDTIVSAIRGEFPGGSCRPPRATKPRLSRGPRDRDVRSGS